jgi:hypothetical protein
MRVFPSDATAILSVMEWPTYLILAIGSAAVDPGCQPPMIEVEEVVAELDFDIVKYEMETT